MSEYQCYEFVALERPLTTEQIAELRAVSTRAEISPTRFWNEYQWGDLRADAQKLMERYFDAHLYFANWGKRRLMLRMPQARTDLKALEPYFVGGHAVRLKIVGKHVFLDLESDTEEPDDEPRQGSLATLATIRAELMRFDLRPAYLAWLHRIYADELDDDVQEPPVPAGLRTLTAAQQELVTILRVDVDLVAAAALASSAEVDDSAPFRSWLTALPPKQKNAWLNRAADEPELALGGELLREFRATRKSEPASVRRTVRELHALAETQRAKREKAEAARAKKAKAAADATRQRHLTKLSRDIVGTWLELEKLVEASRYDEAVTLGIDLLDLAHRDGTTADFKTRFEALRTQKLRRRGFFDRWKRANLRRATGE